MVLQLPLDVLEMLLGLLDPSWRSRTCPGGPEPVLKLNKNLQEELCSKTSTNTPLEPSQKLEEAYPKVSSRDHVNRLSGIRKMMENVNL